MMDEKENRTKICILRLTQSEFDALTEFSKEYGIPKSQYIRYCTFDRKRVFIGKEYFPIYKKICRDSQGIATNINQLAHYANWCQKQGVTDTNAIIVMNKLIDDYLKLDKKLVKLERQIMSKCKFTDRGIIFSSHKKKKKGV